MKHVTVSKRNAAIAAAPVADNPVCSKAEYTAIVMETGDTTMYEIRQNHKKNGIEIEVRGFLPIEAFLALTKRGWGHSDKWNKPYGRYFIRFSEDEFVWAEKFMETLFEKGVILDEKPAPIKDYTRRPVIVQTASKKMELKGTRYLKDEECIHLQDIGWSPVKKSGVFVCFKANYGTRLVEKTKKYIESIGKTCAVELLPKKGEPLKGQVTMAEAVAKAAVSEEAIDFYSVFE